MVLQNRTPPLPKGKHLQQLLSKKRSGKKRKPKMWGDVSNILACLTHGFQHLKFFP